jgi:hypothetical protein
VLVAKKTIPAHDSKVVADCPDFFSARIATRYDKLARNYLASICLAAALVWWI